MNCKIPFTKDIDFEKKVSEITSISLEHETKVEDGVLKEILLYQEILKVMRLA